MALQRRHACEGVRHDSHVKVPFTARARMARVGRTVIAHFELRGLQRFAQQALDAYRGAGACRRPVRGARSGGGAVRSVVAGVHGVLGVADSTRAASQAVCATANRTSAALRPNTLKSTQVRSLMSRATARLAPPSSA